MRRLSAHRQPVPDASDVQDGLRFGVGAHGVVVTQFFDRATVTPLARIHRADSKERAMTASQRFHTKSNHTRAPLARVKVSFSCPTTGKKSVVNRSLWIRPRPVAFLAAAAAFFLLSLLPEFLFLLAREPLAGANLGCHELGGGLVAATRPRPVKVRTLSIMLIWAICLTTAAIASNCLTSPDTWAGSTRCRWQFAAAGRYRSRPVRDARQGSYYR